MASSMALRIRFSPVEYPVFMTATPESFMMVVISWKSTLIFPVLVMISAMPRAALATTSSALLKASVISKSDKCHVNVHC